MGWRFRSAKLESVYLGCLAAMALVHMIAGFCVIKTTGLWKSVPPPVVSLFESFFHVLMFYSISRGYMHLVICTTAAGDDHDCGKCTRHDVLLVLLSCSSVGIGFLSAGGAYVFHIPLLLFLCYQRTCWVDAGGDDLFSATARLGKNNEKIVKTIKFALGMTGTILFQNYFKLNSFKEILAFVYLEVAWLSGVTLIPVSDDFGVLNFLLTNVMVGSTVAEAGLGPRTWLALVMSVLLYRLRLELKSIFRIRQTNMLYVRVGGVLFFLALIYVGSGLYFSHFVPRNCN